MSKSITHFSEKIVCFICRHSNQRTMILLSQFYTARGGTIMNYTKKCRHFYYHAYFFIWNTWWYKKSPQKTCFMCFHFLYIRTPRSSVRSNTYDFCPLIMQRQTGRCHQFFQCDFFANCSADVWVSWKIRKVRKEKALIHHKQESNKKVCVGKFTER